jgi:hypothetical protein
MAGSLATAVMLTSQQHGVNESGCVRSWGWSDERSKAKKGRLRLDLE